MAKAKKVAYNEDAIEALEGLEGVRENVDMYLGHQESQVMHCLREVVENTIDIWSKGLNSFCHIIVSGSKKEQVFTVIDEGPGIPVGVHKKLGISTLEVVLTKLHAGSNFKAQEKDKTATRGKHGVGVSCVCAVSKEFYASTFRDGKWYSQTFSKGRKKTEVERVKNPVTPICAIPKVKSGTVIQYALDKSVMPDTVLTKNQIFDYGRIVSALCKGLKVRVTFNGEEKTFHNKHGIIDALDFFKERNSKKNTDYLGKPFQFEADSIQCAIQWSNLPGEDNVANYVNFASTPDVQSTSVKGAFDVIGRVFKKVKVKGADFTVADLREGMVLVLHYMCNNARYAGQNKEKLNTVEAVEDVKRLLEQPLTKWVKENEKLVRKIIKRASDIRKARAEAKKITQAASSLKASKKNLAGSDKLRMCSKKCPAAERELILAEGDSAGGALFLARNNYNQVILSLRGKPLNVMKTKSVAQDLKNKEIQDILIAIGADPKKIAKGEHLTEVAVGKILLATDADIDGPLEANTKVWMLDGTKPTIKELAQRWEKNPEPFWVLSRNNKGELVPAQAIAPRITTTTDEYIKVTFDNGLVKRVTGNHKWVVNKAKKSEFVSEENGNNYIRTKHLSVGDSINSFYAISSAADGSPEKDFQKWVDSCLEKTNHKVVKLEKVVSKKERNFYCLTVPEHGNFFIDDGDGNGICSGNCHIRTLINCILYKYVRAVFAANMVYILKMPLYQAAWTEKGEEVRSYGDTLEEAMKGAPKRAIVTRFKGLGEMTAEQMQPYAHSDSKLRKLVPITEIEAKRDHDEYMRLTGENTDYRKKMFNIQ